MRRLAIALAVVCGIAPMDSGAAGFDTPVLYSARHLGMGGTGISFVSDPTAMFINPAGLGHTKFVTLTVDFSPILAQNDAPPECAAGPGLLNCSGDRAKTGLAESTGIVFAPAFLVGAGFRVWDHLTLGVGVYPLASAGAKYEYDQPIFEGFDSVSETTEHWEDSTRILFIEVSPALAFDYDFGSAGKLNIGVGYRITIASLQRLKKSEANDLATFDLDLGGLNFLGLRAGLQYQWEGLQIGAVYRHKIVADIEGDSTEVLAVKRGKTTMDLTLPSRLGVGVRYDVSDFGIAVDWEYAFQSQNERSTIEYETDDSGEADTDTVPSFFEWQDAMTVRAGVEYRFLETWAARAGYIWDQETSNILYSSAFGTPPADTHTGTVGFGYDGGPWEINLAYAYRTGSVDVKDEHVKEVADGGQRPERCLTCSFAGTHELTLHGIYLDFSYAWE